MPLVYKPCTNENATEQIFISKNPSAAASSTDEQLIFKPTSPLFYANLARSADMSDILIQDPNPQKGLFYTSHPDLLRALCAQKPVDQKEIHPDITIRQLPTLGQLRWMLIRWLRPNPKNGQSSQAARKAYSDLDQFALQSQNTTQSAAYAKATLRLLLSDHLTFGSPEILDAGVWIFRVGLCWLQARFLQKLCSSQILGHGRE